MAGRKAHTLQNGREPKRARRERARAARRFQQRQRSRRRFVSRAIVAAALVVTIGGLGLVLFRGSVSPSGPVSFLGDFRVGGTIKSLTLPALAGGGSISYSQFDNRPGTFVNHLFFPAPCFAWRAGSVFCTLSQRPVEGAPHEALRADLNPPGKLVPQARAGS